jgi:hypothetical protein
VCSPRRVRGQSPQTALRPPAHPARVRPSQPGYDSSDELAREAHLDDYDQRAILFQHVGRPAEIIHFFHVPIGTTRPVRRLATSERTWAEKETPALHEGAAGADAQVWMGEARLSDACPASNRRVNSRLTAVATGSIKKSITAMATMC